MKSPPLKGFTALDHTTPQAKSNIGAMMGTLYTKAIVAFKDPNKVTGTQYS